MTLKGSIAAAVIGLIAGVGCSSGGDSPTISQDGGAALKPCAEVYAEGAVLKTAEEASTMCDRNGEAYIPAAATTTCTDGRTLFWNDEGWGYIGGRFTRHKANVDAKVAPETDRTACQGS
jgi:hypothetical protein